MKIRGKLILSFCTVTLLILAVFGIITYSTFSGSIRSNSQDLYEAKTNGIMLSIDREIRKAVYHVTKDTYPLLFSQTGAALQKDMLGICNHFASDPEEYGIFDFIAALRIQSENDHIEITPLCDSKKLKTDDIMARSLDQKFITNIGPNDILITQIGTNFYFVWEVLAAQESDNSASPSDTIFLIAKANIDYFKQKVAALLHDNEEDAAIAIFVQDKLMMSVQVGEKTITGATELAKERDADQKIVHFPSQLSSMGMRIEYSITRDFYLRNLITLKNRIIAAMLILMWVAIWVVLIIAYRLSRPILNLARVTNDMIKFNYKSPLDIKPTNDEIGDLAKSFETMRLEIENLVTQDPLTKTYNRRYLMHVFDISIEKAKRLKEELSCIMLDIDHFKKVNDTYGHQAGDEILRELGVILKRNTRAYDTVALCTTTVARFGGEEFTILLPLTSVANAVQIAERIRADVESHVMSNSLNCTLSLGVCGFNHEQDSTPEMLIEKADKALYRAKDNGRNQVVQFISDDEFAFCKKIRNGAQIT